MSDGLDSSVESLLTSDGVVNVARPPATGPGPICMSSEQFIALTVAVLVRMFLVVDFSIVKITALRKIVEID